MNKMLLMAPAAAAMLSACQVAVTRTAPTISNVRTQETFCTNQDTKIDIKFDLGGTGFNALTSLEIYVVNEGVTPTAAMEHDTIAQTLVTGTTSRYTTYYYADTNADGLITTAGTAAVSPKAIIVTPATKRVWLRAFNGDVSGGFIQAQNTMVPSAAANCDPGPASVQ
ncbi:MAG TPA: hypothetical protein VNT60_02095 [Deinococcales bacterium]|nr:hypothetical protein [Deinococcales bacterium]